MNLVVTECMLLGDSIVKIISAVLITGLVCRLNRQQAAAGDAPVATGPCAQRGAANSLVLDGTPWPRMAAPEILASINREMSCVKSSAATFFRTASDTGPRVRARSSADAYSSLRDNAQTPVRLYSGRQDSPLACVKALTALQQGCVAPRTYSMLLDARASGQMGGSSALQQNMDAAADLLRAFLPVTSAASGGCDASSGPSYLNVRNSSRRGARAGVFVTSHSGQPPSPPPRWHTAAAVRQSQQVGARGAVKGGSVMSQAGRLTARDRESLLLLQQPSAASLLRRLTASSSPRGEGSSAVASLRHCQSSL